MNHTVASGNLTLGGPSGPGVLGRFMAEVLTSRNTDSRVRNSCGRCGATSYKTLIARDESGVMRASGQYQCVQCRRVFSSLGEWRGSQADDRQGMASSAGSMN